MLRGDIRRFGYAIDRSVQESERGSIATFNDLPLEKIEEARSIRLRGGRLAVHHYLQFLVARQSDGDADSFCEEVLENGADAQTWRINDCIVGVTEDHCEGIELTIDRYMEALRRVEGERWFRADKVFRPANVIPTAGPGPGVVIRSKRYWVESASPAGVHLQSLVLSSDHRTLIRISDDDMDVAIRRWMASVAAWWSSKYLLTSFREATAEGILAAYSGQVTPSADGWIALRALAREANSGDPRWPSHVGFIGPDEWYRS